MPSGALIVDYASLKTELANWLWNRSDVTTEIPTFIQLAESVMSQILLTSGPPPREMIGRSDGSIANEFEQVPSDFMGVKAFYLPTSGVQPLTFIEPEKLVERIIQNPSPPSGDPQFYSIVGDEFRFYPWSGQGPYASELTYYKFIPALSATNTTNWMITKWPNAYLYGSLLQAAPWLRDDNRIEMWGEVFAKIMGMISDIAKLSNLPPQLSMPDNPYIFDNPNTQSVFP